MDFEVNPLSISRHLEKHTSATSFQFPKISTFITNLRSILEQSNNITVDTTLEGTPTEDNFWFQYTAQMTQQGTKEENLGGKVLLPSSALKLLMNQSHEARRGRKWDSPMIFEISTRQGKRSFCGVLEFSSLAGQIGIPEWMMISLGIKVGTKVQVRRVTLPKGEFVRLQPHSSEFHDNNVKVILETVLRSFVALTVGDTIKIPHNNKTYLLDVVDCKPGRAIAITDLDIVVDFAPPLQETIKDKKKLIDPKLDWCSGPLSVPSYEFPEEEDSVDDDERPLELGTSNKFGDSSLVMGQDYQKCDNCQQKIAIDNFLHLATCKHRNWYCAECDRPVPLTTSKESHVMKAHDPKNKSTPFQIQGREEGGVQNTTTTTITTTTTTTTLSGQSTPKGSSKEEICPYCTLPLSQESYFDHVKTCGGRTEPCDRCQKRIPLEDMVEHKARCSIGIEDDPHKRRKETISHWCYSCNVPIKSSDVELYHPTCIFGEIQSIMDVGEESREQDPNT
eukprot:TRINITY_DN2650_c0_g3_i2.p1 TRINITY_DN2650_c0_g3~~TRINITY_DN2650_c0_g3_i2.p1  ORF type:complete len:506 (-),score=116.25 TRINITY_DN2650_c0_g3_i2:77-1594(-)